MCLGFPAGSAVKNPPANAGDMDSSPDPRRFPGEGNDNHSSILPWRVPRSGEPGGLQAMGCKELVTTE